jgi:hypothetical protein
MKPKKHEKLKNREESREYMQKLLTVYPLGVGDTWMADTMFQLMTFLVRTEEDEYSIILCPEQDVYYGYLKGTTEEIQDWGADVLGFCSKCGNKADPSLRGFVCLPCNHTWMPTGKQLSKYINMEK